MDKAKLNGVIKMNEKEKFIVRISCDPKIETNDIGAKLVDKTLTLRAEKVNESVISQLRDLMKEKGINELFAIDESKVLEIVKKAQVFDIIKSKNVDTHSLRHLTLEEYNYGVMLGKKNIPIYECEILTQEEYDFVKGEILCH